MMEERIAALEASLRELKTAVDPIIADYKASLPDVDFVPDGAGTAASGAVAYSEKG